MTRALLWTPDMLAELHRLAALGTMSGPAIARELGISRSSVAARLNRLGITVLRRPDPPQAQLPAAGPGRGPAPRPVHVAPPALAWRATPLPPMQGNCRWPLWSHGGFPDGRYCDAPRQAPDKPYCSSCAAKAYVPRRVP